MYNFSCINAIGTSRWILWTRGEYANASCDNVAFGFGAKPIMAVTEGMGVAVSGHGDQSMMLTYEGVMVGETTMETQTLSSTKAIAQESGNDGCKQ